MRSICLGGELSGFTGESHADGTLDLSRVAKEGERIVLVCHGAPYVMSAASETVLSPDLLKYKIQAVILTHRAEAAAPGELEDFKKDIRVQCQRVFGLTRGWEKLDASLRARLLEFVTSEDAFPADAEIQSLIGYDSPRARLALRVALEIAFRELESGLKSPIPAADLSNSVLLSPALTIAQQEPSLNQTMAGIRGALSSNRPVLREQVSRALDQLRL
ncbi:MAG TPA: hypothetical protein VK582_07125 [Pyrinomonadaceae bacterium]|nr:hypothetical protein [Pyrinomonadaceae bacterium]